MFHRIGAVVLLGFDEVQTIYLLSPCLVDGSYATVMALEIAYLDKKYALDSFQADELMDQTFSPFDSFVERVKMLSIGPDWGCIQVCPGD